jgi:hypothetical protein
VKGADETTFSKFRADGGKINWVEYLSEEANYQKLQDIRWKWRKTHWRARNPDVEEGPPTDTWFTCDKAIDPAVVRASPPEASDDEPDELNLPGRRTDTRMAVAGEKRKRASQSQSCTKTPKARRDRILASSSSSFSLSGEKDLSLSLSDSESCQESVTQGRRKRRRIY